MLLYGEDPVPHISGSFSILGTRFEFMGFEMNLLSHSKPFKSIIKYYWVHTVMRLVLLKPKYFKNTIMQLEGDKRILAISCCSYFVVSGHLLAIET